MVLETNLSVGTSNFIPTYVFSQRRPITAEVPETSSKVMVNVSTFIGIEYTSTLVFATTLVSSQSLGTPLLSDSE